ALAAGEGQPGAQPPGAAETGLVAEALLAVVIVADADVGDRRAVGIDRAYVDTPFLGHEPADPQPRRRRLHRLGDMGEAGLPLLGRPADRGPGKPVARRLPAEPDLRVADAVGGEPAR